MCSQCPPMSIYNLRLSPASDAVDELQQRRLKSEDRRSGNEKLHPVLNSISSLISMKTKENSMASNKFSKRTLSKSISSTRFGTTKPASPSELNSIAVNDLAAFPIIEWSGSDEREDFEEGLTTKIYTASDDGFIPNMNMRQKASRRCSLVRSISLVSPILSEMSEQELTDGSHPKKKRRLSDGYFSSTRDRKRFIPMTPPKLCFPRRSLELKAGQHLGTETSFN